MHIQNFYNRVVHTRGANAILKTTQADPRNRSKFNKNALN